MYPDLYGENFAQISQHFPIYQFSFSSQLIQSIESIQEHTQQSIQKH